MWTYEPKDIRFFTHKVLFCSCLTLILKANNNCITLNVLSYECYNFIVFHCNLDLYFATKNIISKYPVTVYEKEKN